MDFIADNIGNIAALLVLGVITAAVIAVIVKRRRNGKTSCGCNCAFCNKDCENRK